MVRQRDKLWNKKSEEDLSRRLLRSGGVSELDSTLHIIDAADTAQVRDSNGIDKDRTIFRTCRCDAS